MSLLAAACLLATGACSSADRAIRVDAAASPTPDDGRGQDRPGSKRSAPSAHEKGGRGKGSAGSSTHDGPRSRDRRAIAGSQVAIADPDSDAEGAGESPAYAEVLGVEIAASEAGIHLTVSFKGDLPQELSAEDFMDLGFYIQRGDRTYSIRAEGSDDGWEAYAATKGDSKPIDDFSIVGPDASFEVDWAMIGGKRPFKWQVDSSWTHSSLTATDFAFDSAPNDERARFPSE